MKPITQIVLGIAIVFGSIILGSILGSVVPDGFAVNAGVFAGTAYGGIVGLVISVLGLDR